jgi:hypothetical protein
MGIFPTSDELYEFKYRFNRTFAFYFRVLFHHFIPGSSEHYKYILKVEDKMTVKKLFRLELMIKLDINVEKIKETDYGRKRYTKQLLTQLVKDPEALRDLVIIHFITRYFDDNNEICRLLDPGQNEDFYILRAAEKCPPETQCFFKDLFEAIGSTKKNSKSLSPASEAAIENEKLFDLLQSKLANLVPVKAEFKELPYRLNSVNPVESANEI